MTELQKVEFEILKSVIEICNQLSLNYYLVCGSALGAVKYQGFIPWDDDIDVGLFRKDYEIFCEKAPKMLPDYYFLQNYKTDKNFPALYSKIRDSRTTYIEESVCDIEMHHGIYIDVFPLDGYPIEKIKIKLFETKKKLLNYSLFCAFNINSQCSWKAKVLHRCGRIFNINKRTYVYVDKLSKLVSKNVIDCSTVICNHGNWQGKLEYAPKEQYGNGLMVKFEGLDVRIPEKYDDYLKQKYGDWEMDLPLEKQVGHHYYSVCDFNKSYIEYIKK